MTKPRITKLAGAEVDLGRDLDWGDELVLVLRAKVDTVATKSGSGGPEELRLLKPGTVYELEGKLGERTVNLLAERARAAAAAGATAAFEGLSDAWDSALEDTPALVLTSQTSGALVTPEEAERLAAGDDWETPERHAGDDEPSDVLADLVTVPPFDGYDTAIIPVIEEWLDERTGDEKLERARWVLAYEKAHKARKTLLDLCYGLTEELPSAPDLGVPEDLERPDDEPELDEDTDLELDTDIEAPAPELDADVPDDELDLDDDFDLDA